MVVMQCLPGASVSLRLLSAHQCRALDHPILGLKFSPIPNAKSMLFFSQFQTKNSQFDKKKSLFHIIQIQNILLYFYNFTE